jgi:pimeloyl-ACP methyl ester carboxylesterase
MARAEKRKGKEPWFEELKKLPQQPTPKTDEEMRAHLMKGMPLFWSDPARFEKHKEHFAATSFSVEADRGALESKRVPYNFDLTKQLKQVSAPALIVGGTDDLFNPVAWSVRLHLCLPNSKLLLIEDCGHFPWLEQADVFNAQVPQFLEAIAPGLTKR